MAAAKGKKFFVNSKGHIRDRVIINENEKFPMEGVFVSLNGYAYQIKPGEEIDLPRPVLEMLDTRFTDVPITDREGRIIDTKQVKRVTYTVIKRDVGDPGEVPVVPVALLREREEAAKLGILEEDE